MACLISGPCSPTHPPLKQHLGLFMKDRLVPYFCLFCLLLLLLPWFYGNKMLSHTHYQAFTFLYFRNLEDTLTQSHLHRPRSFCAQSICAAGCSLKQFGSSTSLKGIVGEWPSWESNLQPLSCKLNSLTSHFWQL